jgi:hypothetical protein
MSCYHRYYPHGCGEWPAPPPEWYEAYGYRPRRYRDEFLVVRDDEDVWEDERPRHRRRRRDASPAAEVTPASLQARADALREELSRIEQDLATLASEPDPER